MIEIISLKLILSDPREGDMGVVVVVLEIVVVVVCVCADASVGGGGRSVGFSE